MPSWRRKLRRHSTKSCSGQSSPMKLSFLSTFVPVACLVSLLCATASNAAVLRQQTQSPAGPSGAPTPAPTPPQFNLVLEGGTPSSDSGADADGLQSNTWTVTQFDGRAALEAVFRVDDPVLANETYSSHVIASASATSPLRPVLTSVEGAFPLTNGTGIALRATLRFDGLPGVGSVSVRIVSDAGNAYATLLTFTVRGLAIADEGLVSGSWRNGVDLGPWSDWVGPRRFAVLPIIAEPGLSQGLGVRAREIPVDSVGSPAGISVMQEDVSGVEALRLDATGRACSAAVDLAADGNSDLDESSGESNAFVFRGGARNAARVADVDPNCGISSSSDGRWLVVQLQEYIVGSFGFQVRLSAPPSDPVSRLSLVGSATRHFLGGEGMGTSGAEGVITYVNFFYDTSSIPPPLFPAPDADESVLDPFGGEVLSFSGVANAGVPPRALALGKSDFSLVDGFGSTNKSVSPSRVVSGRNATVEFETVERTEEELKTIQGTNREVDILFKGSGGTPTSNRWTSFRQVSGSEWKKVAFRSRAENDSGSPVEKFSFASPKRAAIGACDSVFKGEDPKSRRYALIRLGLPRYSKSRFSQHKAQQLGKGIEEVLEDGAVRFFEFDNERREAVYEAAVGASQSADILSSKLRSAVDDGSLAGNARLPGKAVKFVELSVAERSEVCRAAEAGARGADGFDGFGGSKLPWVLGLMSGILFLVLAGIVAAFLVLQDKRGRDLSLSSTSESDYVIGSGQRNRRRRMNDRERNESFGLHQDEARRRRNDDVVVRIQPDSETDPESRGSDRRTGGESLASGPAPAVSGPARIWSDRRRRRGSQQVAFVEGTEEVYDEETSETVTSGSERDVYSGSSMRRESREERYEGYVSQSDPLVARLTYALRSQTSSPTDDGYVSRDEARDRVRASPQPYSPFVDRSASAAEDVDGEGGGMVSHESGTFSTSGSGSPVVAYTGTSSRRFQTDRASTPVGNREGHIVVEELGESEGLSVSEASTDGDAASPEASPRPGVWEAVEGGPQGQVPGSTWAQSSTSGRPPTPNIRRDLD